MLENRKLYGTNKLTPPPKVKPITLLAEKFKDPLIIILLATMVLSIVVSAYQFVAEDESAAVFLEPMGIFVAIVLATSIGFWFELSANKKFDILTQDGEEQAVKVIRNGNYCSISKSNIVVGDIVLLEAGDEIPADGILLEAVSLMVNESVLTGEPMVHKTTNSADFDTNATYPSDRAMRGTTVIDGHGIMKVTMVGERTEYGKVYEGAQIDNKIKTPLDIQLQKLSRMITMVSYIVAGLIVVGRGAMFLHISGDELFDSSVAGIGRYILNTIMIAITLIVVAVPEGLPMSVSLSLALSMRRMLSTNNLVRKMHACETMGSATVICTDKTGTLTQNQMRVAETDFYALGSEQKVHAGEQWEILLQSISTNSTANLNFGDKHVKSLGNPTEAALLFWLHSKNVDYREVREKAEIVDQSAFSTEKKYMASVIRLSDEEQLLVVKGAPEIVLSYCTTTVNESQAVVPLTAERRGEIGDKLLTYQNRAMRTLGFAYKKVESGTICFDEKGLLRAKDLVFIGVVGIMDPVRPEVPEAVKSCRDAGIKIKIVTGDTPGTAIEIARQIGLWDEGDTLEKNHITGIDFSMASDKALMGRVKEIKVMSRARPMDKARLVNLLQQQGEVVAVTGDGTNDAPALNAAQVGLSMGDGTTVAKQASAITILDNSFRSINRAVLWGRSLYRNIQRFIFFQLIINIIACTVVLLGAFTGIASPLTVTQMLWVNLIMDTFAAMALASLPPDERVMQEPPRDVRRNIITRDVLVRIVGIGLAGVAVLEFILHILRCNDIQVAMDIIDFKRVSFTLSDNLGGTLTPYELSLFFTIFVMMQFWNLFNAKALHTNASAFKNIHRSPSFVLIVLLILVGQIIIINFGGAMFNVTAITLDDWVAITVVTSLTLWLGELIRLFNYLKRKV